MKSIGLIVGLVAVVALGWWALANLRGEDDASIVLNENEMTQTPNENNGTAETIIIVYGNNGFQPVSTEVPLGSRVVFRNESNNDMWVASDDHPTHQVYSEFDQGKNVGRGESYSFTFDQAGTWGYHNHAKSEHTGTLIVK